MLALDIGTLGSALTLTPRVGADPSRLRILTRAVGSWYSEGSRAELLSPKSLPALVASAQQNKISLHPRGPIVELLYTVADRLDCERELLISIGASTADLYPFQSDGVAWLHSLEAGILADEMGLGKTIQTLCSIPPTPAPPTLIICPKSLKLNWYRETLKWRPDLWPRVYNSAKDFRWPAESEVAIANYELLPKGTDYPPPIPGTRLVADEAQALKNLHSQRTAAFMQLARLVRKRRGRVHLLTGTPIMNKPPELWALLRVLDLHRECYGSQNKFAKLFGGERDAFGFKYEGKDPSPAAATPLLPYILRRRRTDVLKDLPPKQYRTFEVPPPTGELADRLNDIHVDSVIEDLEHDRTPSEDAVAFAATRKDLALHKYTQAQELLQEYQDAQEPLVLFSYHRAPVIAASERKGWLTIYGDRTQKERDAAVSAFQMAGSLAPGIACTISTAAYGLTLTRAAHAVFIDQAFTPAQNLQAEDRIVRIGQTRSTMITNIVCDHPLDKRVHEVLHRKAQIIQKSLSPLETPQTPTPDRATLANELRAIARMIMAPK